MDTVETTQHHKNISVDNWDTPNDSRNVSPNSRFWQIIKAPGKTNVSFDITILAVGFFSKVKEPFHHYFFKSKDVRINL